MRDLGPNYKLFRVNTSTLRRCHVNFATAEEMWYTQDKAPAHTQPSGSWPHFSPSNIRPDDWLPVWSNLYMPDNKARLNTRGCCMALSAEDARKYAGLLERFFARSKWFIFNYIPGEMVERVFAE